MPRINSSVTEYTTADSTTTTPARCLQLRSRSARIDLSLRKAVQALVRRPGRHAHLDGPGNRRLAAAPRVPRDGLERVARSHRHGAGIERAVRARSDLQVRQVQIAGIRLGRRLDAGRIDGVGRVLAAVIRSLARDVLHGNGEVKDTRKIERHDK